MVRDEYKATDDLREYCDEMGGEIRETLASDHDLVREGCVVEHSGDLGTVTVRGGLAAEYEITFGPLNKKGIHREAVQNPRVIAETDSLDGHVTPSGIEISDPEYMMFPSENQF